MIDEEDVDTWERMLTHCEWVSVGTRYKAGDGVVRNTEFWDYADKEMGRYGVGIGIGRVTEVFESETTTMVFVLWPEANYATAHYEEELSLECVGCTQLYES